MIDMGNPLRRAETLGQSIWLDYIRRGIIQGGELRRLIEEDGIRGMTSNPSIFREAVADSLDYDEAIRDMAMDGKGAAEIYEDLSLRDVRAAADMFRPLYDESEGRDGYVSLEVDPRSAHDAEATIGEGRRLWVALDRPNVLIKVPATVEGLGAIRRLTGEGINVNVTLLFGLPRYRLAAEAYVAGIEDRAASGKDVDRIASVASFFVSRIDALIDPLLEAIFARGGRKAELAASCLGQVAVASAKTAYSIQKELFGGERARGLAARGARPQRLLWASTSTKNPAHSDVKYVDALIGPDTVDTIPRKTLDAYRDHGEPEDRLGQGLERAAEILGRLPGLGIDIDSITQRLEDEGVRKFVESFEALIGAITRKGRVPR